jgi:hypothetical protein
MNSSSKIAEIFGHAGEAFNLMSQIVEKLGIEDGVTDYTDQVRMVLLCGHNRILEVGRLIGLDYE